MVAGRRSREVEREADRAGCKWCSWYVWQTWESVKVGEKVTEKVVLRVLAWACIYVWWQVVQVVG